MEERIPRRALVEVHLAEGARERIKCNSAERSSITEFVLMLKEVEA